MMLTVLIPEADQKAGLAFFVNKGPKANPLWATDDIKAFTTLDPFTATASVAKFVRYVSFYLFPYGQLVMTSCFLFTGAHHQSP